MIDQITKSLQILRQILRLDQNCILKCEVEGHKKCKITLYLVCVVCTLTKPNLHISFRQTKATAKFNPK